MKRRKRRLTIWMALLLATVWTLAAQASEDTTAAGTNQPAAGAGQQADESAVQTGWQKINGKRYYVKADGTHRTGWFTSAKKKYYLDPKADGAAATGLKKIGKKYYIFSQKGQMLKSKNAYQVGKNFYTVNSKGVAKKLSGAEKLAAKQLKKLTKPKLRYAFDWAAKLRYQAISTAGKKPQDFATYGFTRRRGDCNVQACVFYYMAKVLGYDTHYVKGTVPQANGTSGKHAWVEIDMKGKTYVFDPNLAGQYASVFGKNTGWRFRYGAKHTYKYQNIKRVN